MEKVRLRAKLRAEEEERLQAEEQAKLKAIEEARLRFEEEEEARLKAEKEAKLKAEEEARLREEESARLRAEELSRIRREEEMKLQRDEEERRAKELLDLKKIKVEECKNVSEEDERKKAERMAVEEEMRLEQEKWLVEEQMRKFQEEHKKKMKAEEQKRLMEAEERQRQAAEDKKRAIEEERQARAAEEERRKKAAEEQRRLAEERRKIVLEEQKRLLEEEHIRKAEETERIQQEEAKRQTAEEEEAMDDNDGKLMSEEDIKLPQAIEKVLALKSERAQLLGVDPEAAVEDGSLKQISAAVTLVSVDEDDAEEEEPAPKNKEAKGRRRRKKKKKRSARVQVKAEKFDDSTKDSGVDIDVEYVQEVINITDPMYSQFMRIFERFKLTDAEKEKEEAAAAEALKEQLAKEESVNPLALRKKPMDLDDDDDDPDDDDKVEEEKPKLSKRKLKKLSRMTVAELKQKVNRPELVEMHDVTAKDPVLLLHLKASRNTVPVPRHWCFKRKYLQGKRGIEKPAFELPDFIKRTGIMEMRQALQEKEDQKTMKAKMRERVRPKLGKIDIDYQKLHDAFFKWQTKPKMTIHGDLYYEGKEFETRLKEKKPGDLSEDLRTALGMPTGPNANKCPPPWLIAMQRYGPPPSYPNLKIPGLNAPIPDDCTFGYHAGGWGKPPVDETGRPLYGDVFGTQVSENQMHIQEEEIDHTLWGELESESSEESEEEDEEEEDEEEGEKAEDESGLVTPAEGLVTPSGFR